MTLRILQREIEMRVLIDVVEKRKSGRKNEDAQGGCEAQQEDNLALGCHYGVSGIRYQVSGVRHGLGVISKYVVHSESLGKNGRCQTNRSILEAPSEASS